jgi:hypothetical protein
MKKDCFLKKNPNQPGDNPPVEKNIFNYYADGKDCALYGDNEIVFDRVVPVVIWSVNQSKVLFGKF